MAGDLHGSSSAMVIDAAKSKETRRPRHPLKVSSSDGKITKLKL